MADFNGGTVGGNILPDTTGRDLGSLVQAWDAFIQQLNLIGGTSGSVILAVPAVAGSNTITIPAATDTLVGKATTDTLTNKTLTSPTINTPTISSPVITGTPSGAGIPTITQKTGSGGGNYTTSSASDVDVDGTNLAYTVTVPVGWKAAILATGGASNSSSNGAVVLADSTTSLHFVPIGTTTSAPFAVSTVFTGDGASHVFKLRFSAPAGTTTIANGSAFAAPVMIVTLTPSN